MNNKVNIRPNVSILSVLKFLEYETWYALAEFVDNAIESYQKNEVLLKKVEGEYYQLEVKIEINELENSIIIRDNAAGIEEENYSRAFRAAEAPTNTSGLSEFGMGMKSAACWFSDSWSVRTTSVGEDVERTIAFEMDEIFEDKIEELEFQSKIVNKNTHYTVIELRNVHKIPRRKGEGKVKSHLTSIYREFIRKGVLKLFVKGMEQEFHEPNILKAPIYNDPGSKAVTWKKEIDFPIGNGQEVKGFVAIREKGSTKEAGFALFRRGRVIEGSYDKGFRPQFIFGSSNSYKYQRVFGELHLEGFDVSFTKKGIQWDDDNLDIFLELLKDDISNSEFPLLQQAENYRVRAKESDYQKSGGKVLNKAVKDLQEKAPKAIQETFEKGNIEEDSNKELIKTDKTIRKEFDVNFNKLDWKIFIELSYDPSLKDMIEVGKNFIPSELFKTGSKQVGIRLSLVHPFMIQFAGTDNIKIEPILRIAAAFGLAEIIARESGAKSKGEIRRNFNELITKISI